MNQRREARSPVPTIALAVVFALLVGFVLYWFVIRDDSDDKKDSTPKPKALAAQTFTAPGASFTFEYPGNFALTNAPEGKGFVWIGGVGPYDALNVKRISNTPIPVSRLKVDARRSLSATPGVKIVGEGTEIHDGVTMVRFDLDSTLGKLSLHSQLFQFVANKVTWQFECGYQSETEMIQAACARALATFKAS